MRIHYLAIAGILALTGEGVLAEDYLGQLSAQPIGRNSTSNPYGPYGSEFSSDSVNNPFGRYGSPFSNDSARNPFASNPPKLYDSEGNYRGKLSANPFDPESISNPFGRYGSPYSADSVNNRFGAGSPFKPDSPNNPLGEGWEIRSH